VGIFMGLVAAEEWPTILLYVNGVPFGQTDPIFNSDIGFYVFGLPFYGLLRGWALALLVIAAVGVAIVYLAASGVSQIGAQLQEAARGSTPQFRFNLDSRISTHLSVLGALFLLLIAVGYWLQRFNLLFSSNGAVDYGAGYT